MDTKRLRYQAAAAVISLGVVTLVGCSKTTSDMQATIQRAVTQTPQPAIIYISAPNSSVTTALGATITHVFAVIPKGETKATTRKSLHSLLRAGWLKASDVEAWTVNGTIDGLTHVLTPESTPRAKNDFERARKAIVSQLNKDVWTPLDWPPDGEKSTKLYRNGVCNSNGTVSSVGQPTKELYFANELSGTEISPLLRALRALVDAGYLNVQQVPATHKVPGSQTYVLNITNATDCLHHIPIPLEHPDQDSVELYSVTRKGRPWLVRDKSGTPMVKLAAWRLIRVLQMGRKPFSSEPVVTFSREFQTTPTGSMHAVRVAVKSALLGHFPVVSGTQQVQVAFKTQDLRAPDGVSIVRHPFDNKVALTLYTVTPTGQKHIVKTSSATGIPVVIGRWEPSAVTNYSAPAAKFGGDIMVEVTFKFHPTVTESLRWALIPLARGGQTIPLAGAPRKEQCMLLPMHTGYRFDGCRLERP